MEDLVLVICSCRTVDGLLFASLRKSTQANLRAISEQVRVYVCNVCDSTDSLWLQRIALEAARRSQEEAIHATRVKSIFLANMSHEMRTVSYCTRSRIAYDSLSITSRLRT
jgi:signal transduction histidine kinase